jgi:hypothetical protein
MASLAEMDQFNRKPIHYAGLEYLQSLAQQ